MDINGLLIELFGRIDGHVRVAVDGLDTEQLRRTPAPGTNSIGWLVWHLTRVQDHHMSELFDQPQIWMSGGWAARFGVTADPNNTGYSHSAEEVEAIKPESAAALVEYYEAVSARTLGFLRSVSDADLERIVDRRFTPPVTMAVRLISVADDDIQHGGQAAYVRGLLDLD